MSKKARRVATRQAELAARGKRKARHEGAIPRVSAEAPIPIRSSQPIVGPAPRPEAAQRPSATPAPTLRAPVYQYVGKELRRIVVLAALVFMALAVLAAFLR